jgi:hypothetical protein
MYNSNMPRLRAVYPGTPRCVVHTVRTAFSCGILAIYSTTPLVPYCLIISPCVCVCACLLCCLTFRMKACRTFRLLKRPSANPSPSPVTSAETSLMTLSLTSSEHKTGEQLLKYKLKYQGFILICAKELIRE